MSFQVTALQALAVDTDCLNREVFEIQSSKLIAILAWGGPGMHALSQ